MEKSEEVFVVLLNGATLIYERSLHCRQGGRLRVMEVIHTICPVKSTVLHRECTHEITHVQAGRLRVVEKVHTISPVPSTGIHTEHTSTAGRPDADGC